LEAFYSERSATALKCFLIAPEVHKSR